MNLQPQPSHSPSALEQRRTPLAPAAHGQPLARADDEGHEDPFAAVEMARIAAVALASASVWFGWWEPLRRSTSSVWQGS